VQDSKSNCGSAYRVAANITETAGDAALITAGVAKPVLFHGPTCLYGVDPATGAPVALETAVIPNVFNIMRCGGSGQYYEQDTHYTGVVHHDGDYGKWVMMAGQKYAGPLANNKVIASGGSPYGDYQPLWVSVYYAKQLDGQTLVKNAILWGLNVEVQAPPVAIAGFALAAGLLMALVAIPLFLEKH